MINDLNIPVFTVKDIGIYNRPIVYVVHDEDGEWQFLGSGEYSAADIMIVSMRQILELDNSIEQILSLPPGMEAHRKDIRSKWETKVYKAET